MIVAFFLLINILLAILVDAYASVKVHSHFFFFFTLVTGPGRSLSLRLSDTRDYEPQIRARLGPLTS